MADQWHVTRDEKKSGPFSSTALRRLAVSGKLLPSDSLVSSGIRRLSGNLLVATFCRVPSYERDGYAVN